MKFIDDLRYLIIVTVIEVVFVKNNQQPTTNNQIKYEN